MHALLHFSVGVLEAKTWAVCAFYSEADHLLALVSLIILARKTYLLNKEFIQDPDHTTRSRCCPMMIYEVILPSEFCIYSSPVPWVPVMTHLPLTLGKRYNFFFFTPIRYLIFLIRKNACKIFETPHTSIPCPLPIGVRSIIKGVEAECPTVLVHGLSARQKRLEKKSQTHRPADNARRRDTAVNNMIIDDISLG